nr:MAG TPA: hypothetical protein [Caudoviricetes sp.]
MGTKINDCSVMSGHHWHGEGKLEKSVESLNWR